MKKSNSTLSFVAATLADAILGKSPRRGRSDRSFKIYMADNSRLRANAHVRREEVDALCKGHLLQAEWPSEHFLLPSGLTIADRKAVGLPIDDKALARPLARSWKLIGRCDALIAEVTPFRGPHLNPVVAFEIGVAVVHEIPVFAWTTASWPSAAGAGSRRAKTLDDRIWAGDAIAADGNWRDEDGNLVENFDLVESARIAGHFVSVSCSLPEAIASCAGYLAPLAPAAGRAH